MFLEPLEARLEHLALKTPDIFTKDALSPINICQAFDDALAEKQMRPSATLNAVIDTMSDTA